MDSQWALVMLTFVLVGVTGYYAWQTRLLVGEANKQRRLLIDERREKAIALLSQLQGDIQRAETGLASFESLKAQGVNHPLFQSEALRTLILQNTQIHPTARWLIRATEPETAARLDEEYEKLEGFREYCDKLARRGEMRDENVAWDPNFNSLLSSARLAVNNMNEILDEALKKLTAQKLAARSASKNRY
jgi:sugar-specific transcriptional regulator TrmB